MNLIELGLEMLMEGFPVWLQTVCWQLRGVLLRLPGLIACQTWTSSASSALARNGVEDRVWVLAHARKSRQEEAPELFPQLCPSVHAGLVCEAEADLCRSAMQT